jgi:hypothetical protein
VISESVPPPVPDPAVLIDNRDERVVIDIGVMMVVMTADEAEAMGSALIWHAAALRGGITEL